MWSLMRDYWCLKYSLSLSDFSFFFLVNSPFCHCPSSKLLINAEIFEESIHVSLLYNTMVPTLKTYSTQIRRSKKPLKIPRIGPFYMKYHILFYHCLTPSTLLPLLYSTRYVSQPKQWNGFVLLIFYFCWSNILCV